MPKSVSSIARPPSAGDVVEHKSKRIDLALDDPLAWANSVSFPVSNPDARAVKAHVSGSNFTKIPVAWKRGTGRQVKWCSPSMLTVVQHSHQSKPLTQP